MPLLNTEKEYGWFFKVLHWVTVPWVLALFALGLWMVGFDYYSPWYKTGPNLHRSFGVLLVLLVLIRLALKLFTRRPAPLHSHKPWERRLAGIVHYALYLALLSMFFSGYFITTADGQALEIFGFVSLPSIITEIDNLEDIAGVIHEYTAYTVVLLIILHVVAVVKHSVKRDGTLQRMMFNRS